jgi:hypothetical protein
MEPGEHFEMTVRNVSEATLGQDEWLNLDLLTPNDGQSPHIDSDYHVTTFARGPIPPIPPHSKRTLTMSLDFPQVLHPSGQIQFTEHTLCVVADPVTLSP